MILPLLFIIGFCINVASSFNPKYYENYDMCLNGADNNADFCINDARSHADAAKCTKKLEDEFNKCNDHFNG